MLLTIRAVHLKNHFDNIETFIGNLLLSKWKSYLRDLFIDTLLGFESSRHLISNSSEILYRCGKQFSNPS
jgi:hypothetical protein